MNRIKTGASQSILFFVVIDQLSKAAVLLTGLRIGNGVIALEAYKNTHPGLIRLTTAQAAQSTTVGILNITAALIIVGMLVVLITQKKRLTRSTVGGLVLISAGGISNVIDWLLHGAIIDIATVNRLMANLADLYIGIGALLVVIAAIQRRSNQTAEKR